MKREKISDAVGGIDPAYLEEAARHRAASPIWIRWAAAAACVCLIAGAVLLARPAFPDDPLTDDTGTIDPPVIDTEPQPTEPIYDPFNDPNVLWGKDGGLITDAVFPTLSDGISVSWELLSTLNGADGNDPIAVVVCGTAGNSMSSSDTHEDLEYEHLMSAFTDKEFEMTNIYLDRANHLAEDLNISFEEARARAYSDPEYLAAKADCIEAAAAAANRYYDRVMELHSPALTHFEEQGMLRVFDGSDATYHPYLRIFSGLGVMVGTKDEIYALDAGENKYTLYLASDRAAEYDHLGYNPYIGGEITLPAGSKLTTDLQAAYEENGGQAIPVVVKIAYWGPRYTIREADAIVLQNMGFSSKEDLFCNGTEADEDYFTEEKNRLFYHKDYNEEVALRLTEDGELVQYNKFENYYDCNFYAILTYERALELAESNDVAYLRLPDSAENYWPEMDDGIYIE